jgi:hypothetical protein
MSYEIVEAAQLKDKLPSWFITYQGFQVGGEVDRSGAGNLTFSSYAEALARCRIMSAESKSRR